MAKKLPNRALRSLEKKNVAPPEKTPQQVNDEMWKDLLAKGFNAPDPIRDYIVIAVTEKGMVNMADNGAPYTKLGALEHMKSLITTSLAGAK